MKYILLLLLIMSCGDEPIKSETFEIKDKITGNIHIFKKEPKLKKSILYCLKDKENKVVWVHWHVDQIP